VEAGFVPEDEALADKVVDEGRGHLPVAPEGAVHVVEPAVVGWVEAGGVDPVEVVEEGPDPDAGWP